jgi:hypothetical protein
MVQIIPSHQKVGGALVFLKKRCIGFLANGIIINVKKYVPFFLVCLVLAIKQYHRMAILFYFFA